MNVFYIKELRGGKAWFSEEESRHCIKVFRMKQGDAVLATDGFGNLYKGRLFYEGKEKAGMDILENLGERGEHPGALVLAVSPLRLPDRFEWLAEKAVELGVTRIVPVICERTVKQGFRKDRIEKIMIAAMKQSMRTRLPELDDPMGLDDYLKSETAAFRCMGYCESKVLLNTGLTKLSSVESLSLLIGPEGDFTEQEITAAISAGYQVFSFGEVRLRTETAALFGLSALKAAKGW